MNYTTKIIKESMPVLLLASIITSIGGIALQSIQQHLITFLPFLIMLPALNALVGDFGIILVSKLTTYLYAHKKNLQGEKHYVHHLLRDVIIAASFTTCYIVLLSLVLATLQGFSFNADFVIKMVIITALVIAIMLLITGAIACFFSLYAWKHHEDPDDVLLPITTSIADLGSMIALSILINIFF